MDEYTAWAVVPENLKTKTQLSGLGLRLSPGQEPEAWFYSKKYRRTYGLYDLHRARPKRQISEAQRAALELARQASIAARTCTDCGRTQPPGRKLDEEGLCDWCAYRRWVLDQGDAAVLWARGVLGDANAVLLDTETTGLDGDAELVEIGIIDIRGSVLIDQLVRPQSPIPAEVSAIHGINADTVAGAPTWDQVYGDVASILNRASRVVVYNAEFDRRIIRQTNRRYGLPRIEVASWECAMEEYEFRWQPLNGGHRAVGTAWRHWSDSKRWLAIP